jgi:hypothetical protein
MNSSNLFPNIWRFIGLVLIQALVLKQVSLQVNEYFNILLYPLFILFLPIELPTAFAVMLGFLIGLTVDFFYVSPGVHASAGAWSGFTRSILLAAFEPRAGFKGKEIIPSPANFGWRWFLQITSIFMFLHLFWYFSVDAFTFVYIGTISLKTLASWIFTMLFVLFYGFLFNPKN